MSVRLYLTAEEYRRCKRALGRALAANAPAWNASGWSVIRVRRGLRIAVHVSRKLTRPAVAVGTLRLPRSIGGGELKLAVRAIHDHLPARGDALVVAADLPFEGGASQAGAVLGFSPGSAVGTPGGRGGVAAFVSNADGIFALTCGHTFASGDDLERGGRVVGTLVENLLDDAEPMDVALCELDEAGIADATASSGSPTWLAKVHTPSDGDNDRDAMVYPTHHGAGLPFNEVIESYSTCETIDGLQLCDLVALPECTVKGDSGTLVSIDGEYLGICRGSTGHLSCFTPVRDAILRLRASFPALRIWRPT